MSIHATLSPEAQAKLAAQRRNSTISSIIISLLVCALLAVILWIISLTPLFKNNEETISYAAQSNNENEIVKPEITNEVETKPSSPSSSLSKVITSLATSPTSIPVPEITAEEPSLDFGDGNDFGNGWGSGSGNGSGSGSGGTFTAFGKTGGDGMSGFFYDLKQDSRRKDTSLGKFYHKHKQNKDRIRSYMKEIEGLDRGKFSESRLKKYYKANTKLNFTFLAMEITNANSAPAAFGVEKEVDPAGWLINYEGTVIDAPKKRVRFHGIYDDLLIVYVNNKVVFDGSLNPYTREHKKMKLTQGKSLIQKRPMSHGDFIQLKVADKLRIVVGESPGGRVGGALLVEVEGESYKKIGKGQLSLPPFATEPLRKEDIRALKKFSYRIETDNVPIFKVR